MFDSLRENIFQYASNYLMRLSEKLISFFFLLRLVNYFTVSIRISDNKYYNTSADYCISVSCPR